MWAAAEGRSTLGIPQSVGKEFIGKDAKLQGAGIAFTAPKGHVLFLKRGGGGDHVGEWCLPGGTCEGDESFEATAAREAAEEVGEFPSGLRKPMGRHLSDDGVDFVTFKQNVPGHFIPTLNDEHTDFRWKKPDEAPQPLHPGVAALFERLGMDGKILAFDRDTTRRVDHDGRMHVDVANISKAAVNPYKGNEIPNFEALGLDPGRIYMLFRDPEELAKAAPSFNNIQLLMKHVAVNAVDPKKNLVVGSTGTDAKFEAPYLKNSLVVWTQDAIDAIDSDEQKELSCAYRYRADMTPGTYQGQRYDGVMRDIIGNHVALVKEGRAGSDVVVGDSAIPKMEKFMTTKAAIPLSRKAAVAKGALMVFLEPKLALDAKIDLDPILLGLTHQNLKDKKAGIIAAITAAAKDKLAKDAKLSDLTDHLTKVVDALGKGGEETEDATLDPATGLPAERGTTDGDPDAKANEFLKGKLSPGDWATYDSMRGKKAMDETPEQKLEREKKEKEAKDAAMKDMVTKPAMDAAIADAVTKATKEATAAAQKNATEIRQAEKAVRPYVGELAMDSITSAEDVYRAALKILKVPNIEAVHASALPAILGAIPKPDGKKSKSPALGMDAAGQKTYDEMFPGASRIGAA